MLVYPQGLGKVSGSHPLPRLLILLQITGRIFEGFLAPSPTNCPVPGLPSLFHGPQGILTQWGPHLQHWPLLGPLLQPARSFLSA